MLSFIRNISDFWFDFSFPFSAENFHIFRDGFYLSFDQVYVVCKAKVVYSVTMYRLGFCQSLFPDNVMNIAGEIYGASVMSLLRCWITHPDLCLLWPWTSYFFKHFGSFASAFFLLRIILAPPALHCVSWSQMLSGNVWSSCRSTQAVPFFSFEKKGRL